MPLVGYWPLNENSGSTATDYSGQGNNGTVNNGGDSTVVAGSNFLGQNAYSFDGSNDGVELSTNSLLDGSKNWTVCAWVKITEGTEKKPYVSCAFGGSGNKGFNLRVDSKTPNGFFYDSNDNSTSLGANNSINLDNWTMLVFKVKQNDPHWYIDGSSDASKSASNTLSTGGNNYWIGRRPPNTGNSSRDFYGGIAEVRVYNHPLTEKEIQYLYEAGKRGRLTTNSKRA